MAIDRFLKEEFDHLRMQGKPHEVMKKNKIKAVPFKHDDMDKWRNNFKGVQVEHEETGFLVFGAVDDIWVTPEEELIVVDYKATGAKEINIYDSYKRQMEVYQWLLSKNGFNVSNTGYFLFAHLNKEAGFKDAKLSFDLHIKPCEGDNSWVEDSLIKAKACMEGTMPDPGDECDYCRWYFQQQS